MYSCLCVYRSFNPPGFFLLCVQNVQMLLDSMPGSPTDPSASWLLTPCDHFFHFNNINFLYSSSTQSHLFWSLLCLKYLFPKSLSPLLLLTSRLSTRVLSTRKTSKPSPGWAKYHSLSFHVSCAYYNHCSHHIVVKLSICASKARSLSCSSWVPAGCTETVLSYAFRNYLLNCSEDYDVLFTNHYFLCLLGTYIGCISQSPL